MPAVRRLQHASVPMPVGGADEARRFYAHALGMPEIHRPRGLSHLTLVWFSAGEDGAEVYDRPPAEDLRPATLLAVLRARFGAGADDEAIMAHDTERKRTRI